MLHHILPSRALVILLTICIIANNLPVIESQSAQSCVAPPCAYKDECRNKFSECGVGDAYCNVESLWRPFCGGGGNMERTTSPTPQPTRPPQSATPPPLPLPLPSPTPQPTLRNTPKPTTDNRPATNRPTTMNNRQPTNRPQSDPTLPPQLSSILSPKPPAPTPPKVTSNPTTSFEGWLNDEDPSNNNNNNGGGYNVDYTQTTNSNQTGWFDKEGWDSSRGQEDEGSAFNFWGGNNNNGGTSCLVNGCGGVHVTLLVVFTTLYYAVGGV